MQSWYALRATILGSDFPNEVGNTQLLSFCSPSPVLIDKGSTEFLINFLRQRHCLKGLSLTEAWKILAPRQITASAYKEYEKLLNRPYRR